VGEDCLEVRLDLFPKFSLAKWLYCTNEIYRNSRSISGNMSTSNRGLVGNIASAALRFVNERRRITEP
jgi:hypothetical protein